MLNSYGRTEEGEAPYDAVTSFLYTGARYT